MPTPTKLTLLLAGCLFCAALAPPIAVAGDVNAVPPRVELLPAGTEGLVGPRMEALAYFSTSGLGSAEEKGWEYTKGSKVTFACSVDGRPVRCPAEYVETFEGGVLLRAKASGSRERRLPGPFEGYVPMPKNLPAGPHTVTVVATDEDGTDPEPPSIAVIMDRTPPAAPQLTQVPPRRSKIRKPIFRFSASDEVRLVSTREIFTAVLRRLQPTRAAYRDTFANSFLEVWGPRCPTLLTCSTRAQASYMVNERWYSYGEPERLIPGLYELRVRARDAVGNKSAPTTYRFRILRGKPG